MKHMIIRFSISPSFFDGKEVKLVLSSSDSNSWNLSGYYGSMYDRKKINKSIPSTHVEAILNELINTKIPIPSFATGLDGTTYQLDFECGFNSVSYRWWEEVPESFEGINQLCKTLLSWAGIKNYDD
jgi:hypothetical protein